MRALRVSRRQKRLASATWAHKFLSPQKLRTLFCLETGVSCDRLVIMPKFGAMSSAMYLAVGSWRGFCAGITGRGSKDNAKVGAAPCCTKGRRGRHATDNRRSPTRSAAQSPGYSERRPVGGRVQGHVRPYPTRGAGSTSYPVIGYIVL